jgi:hypothetical protein
MRKSISEPFFTTHLLIIATPHTACYNYLQDGTPGYPGKRTGKSTMNARITAVPSLIPRNTAAMHNARKGEKADIPEKACDRITLEGGAEKPAESIPPSSKNQVTAKSRVDDLLGDLMFHIIKKGLIMGAEELCGGLPVSIAAAALSQLESAPLHATDRQIRIKIPALKHNPDEAGKVVRAFRKDFRSIESASVNEYTGSLTIDFSPGSITSKQVIAKIAKMGYGESFENLLRESTLGAKLGKAGKAALKGAAKKIGKDALLPSIEEHLGEKASQIVDFLL